MNPQATQGSPFILVVDDDDAVRRSLARILELGGFAVDVASDGTDALTHIASRPYDAILSDISMPGMDGMAMLRAVRQYDMDVPVILITGAPGINQAHEAIQHGALGYLPKPVDPDRLRDVMKRGVRLHEFAKLKRLALQMHGSEGDLLGDRAGLEARLERAMTRMWLAYQPVVTWRERRVLGYEALLRSDETSLSTPLEILRVAQRLGRVGDVGHAIRLRLAEDIPQTPAETLIFLNVHPDELRDPRLVARSSALAPFAHRIVLDVSERMPLAEVQGAMHVTEALRGLGFRFAIDDLGAGYAGLTNLAMLSPDIVKLDLSLTRDVDQVPARASLIKSIALLCGDLGMKVIAEGVETPGERDELVRIGIDLLQGYLFSQPTRGFPKPLF